VRHDPRRHRVSGGIRKDGVAVGVGLDDRTDAERAAGAAAVLDDDGLAEHGRKLIEYRARDHVGGAAGAERDVGLDGPLGPVVGQGGAGPEGEPGKQGKERKMGTRHVSSPNKPRPCGPSRYAAFMPCRLWEASFTVKNTTSPSAVALPPCTVFDGM